MSKWMLLTGVIFFALIANVAYWSIYNRRASTVATPLRAILDKPLERYTIENLGRRQFEGSQIVLDEAIATTSAYTSFRFHFLSDRKRVTGLAHIPRTATETNKYPVIVQLRGYVDREIYKTGDGTRRSGEVFARNGFITLAPDFLGYGDSDPPSGDIFEERFQTYTTALTLLSSVKTLPIVDPSRIGIWGHSNGGQIALTVLVATRQPYPTSLWAPVSKPFPYSILYYTDEAQDKGRLIRQRLAKFEELYDVDLYSLTNYVDRITASLQIHQGTADEAVPLKWSDEFVSHLKEKEKEVTYFTYVGADHNMSVSSADPPVGGWNLVVARDIEFYTNQLK